MTEPDVGSAPPGEPGEHRDGVPGEKTPAGQLVQFSSGLSKPFIQRPVMTMLLTASLIVFGILTFKLLSVNDLPAVDYPVISVSANYPGANPETMANTIATPLEKQFTQIPGLTLTTSSSTQGSTNITLQFDPEAVASRNLTLDELSTAISNGTSYQGAGQFDGKNMSLVLRPNGQLSEPEGYRNLIVARGKDGSPVYLRDVAHVIETVQDERLSRHFFARGYQTPASVVVLAVSRQAGANAVQVAQSINQLIPQMRLELPGSINLIPTFNRSLSIVHSVSDVQATLFIAFVLVVLVIFIFLGRARDTLIPVVRSEEHTSELQSRQY